MSNSEFHIQNGFDPQSPWVGNVYIVRVIRAGEEYVVDDIAWTAEEDMLEFYDPRTKNPSVVRSFLEAGDLGILICRHFVSTLTEGDFYPSILKRDKGFQLAGQNSRWIVDSHAASELVDRLIERDLIPSDHPLLPENAEASRAFKMA